MHLITLILGVVLLPKVSSLKCQMCMDSKNCSVMTCPASQSQCCAMTILAYAGGAKINEFQIKSCTSPAECIQGSVNFGVSAVQIASQCCNTDLCNRNAVPAPKKTSPNGNQCYTCNGQWCDGTIKCQGDEDHCISTERAVGDEKMSFMGCASRMVCAQPDNPQIKQSLGGVFKCCQGNLCNGGRRSSTSAVLLLLSTLLLPLVMSS